MTSTIPHFLYQPPLVVPHIGPGLEGPQGQIHLDHPIIRKGYLIDELMEGQNLGVLMQIMPTLATDNVPFIAGNDFMRVWTNLCN